MKKLKLNLDEIKVESFETVTKKENLVGTVIGHLEAPAETNNCPVSEAMTCDTCSPMWCYWHGTDAHHVSGVKQSLSTYSD